MSTFRNPVGPQPSRVYWRRRLVLLLAAVAIIVIVVLLIVRPGAGADDAGATTSPDATGEAAASDAPADPSATPSTEPVEGAECDPAVVRIEAITDTNSYAAGQLPQLSFKVTNTSGTSCTLNLGTTQQSFVVTSGEEQYWSSKDCETDPVDAPTLLEPNLAQTSTPFGWDRTRSAVGACDTPGDAVPASGATYNLTVTVGTAEPSTVSFLLN